MPRSKTLWIPFAMLLVGMVNAGGTCGTAPGGDTDVGSDGGWTLDGDDRADGDGAGDLALTLGRLDEDSGKFEVYADGEASVEIVSGFQGGFHVEPSLLLEGLEVEDFETKLEYEVRTRDDGEVLTRPTVYEVGSEFAWIDWEAGEGQVHHSNPVIFDVSDPSEVEGETVVIWVRVKVVDTGQEVTAEKDAELVDEVNELGR